MKEKTAVMHQPEFDYALIPVGYYDRILCEETGVRKAWHYAKFIRVVDILPDIPGGKILDVGCSAGSFLSFIPEEKFPIQVGVDIATEQVKYASEKYGKPFRKFMTLSQDNGLKIFADESFDVVTMIEVIEHLNTETIDELFGEVHRILKPGGTFIFSTPNYGSMWPLLEVVVNKLSAVKYEDQHITKFFYSSIEKRLAQIHPAFFKSFGVRLKTTTHMITPFVAGVSYWLSERLMRLLPASKWKLPFGSLILMSLKKN